MRLNTIITASLILGIVLSACSSAGRRTESPAPGGLATETSLIEAQSQRFDAMTRGDLPALDRILADDLTYVHSTAKADSKSDFLASLRSGATKYKVVETRNVKARVYGETGIITGDGLFQVLVGGAPQSNQLRFTSVYVRRNGRWQMVAWQSIRLPAQ